VSKTDIEVEVRSFITKEKYLALIDFMKKHAEFLKEDNQITYYFSGDVDVRIQRNDFFSKIWIKDGEIHDDHRKETEIRFPKEKFEELEKLFLALGYAVEVKWFRKRHEFKWKGITVAIDDTKDYGYIIELEKMSSGADKEDIYKELTLALSTLGVGLTPKEEFDRKFTEYKDNWKEIF